MLGVYVPQRVFFTQGVATHKNKLQSFEGALRKAGIAPLNLVSVSSILPPHAKIITRAEGQKLLKPGQITFCVMAREETNEPGRLVHASVGLAQPSDPAQYGYLSEHHGHGQTAKQSGDYSEDLAATMLAETLGIEFDPDTAYDERKELYRMSGRIVHSRSVTASGKGDKDGLWTTCVAAAVLLP
jgi:arginine decarboxylase